MPKSTFYCVREMFHTYYMQTTYTITVFYSLLQLSNTLLLNNQDIIFLVVCNVNVRTRLCYLYINTTVKFCFYFILNGSSTVL